MAQRNDVVWIVTDKKTGIKTLIWIPQWGLIHETWSVNYKRKLGLESSCFPVLGQKRQEPLILGQLCVGKMLDYYHSSSTVLL